MEIGKTGINLRDVYPQLGPGFLCQNTKGQRQWVGLPLLDRPGYFSFRGTYVASPYLSHAGYDPVMIAYKAFDRLEDCQYCRGDLPRALQGRLRKGFRLVEDQVSLEGLIQRRDLMAHQLQDPPVLAILVETFHEVRFRSLTTKPLCKDALWV